MLAIPPKPPELPYQEKLFHAVHTSAAQFPSEISKIVVSYALDVTTPLTFDEEGNVTNPDVFEAQKSTLMSGDSPTVTKIFGNFSDPKCQNPRFYQRALRSMCRQIADQGYRLNLDGICANNLSMKGFDFTNISARMSVFFNVEFIQCKFTGGDLSNARFINCHFMLTDLNGVNALGVEYDNVEFYKTHVKGMITDDPDLQKISWPSEVRFNSRWYTQSIFITKAVFTTDLPGKKVSKAIVIGEDTPVPDTPTQRTTPSSTPNADYSILQ